MSVPASWQQTYGKYIILDYHKHLEEQLPILKEQIKKNGTVRISWNKKTAGKPTELTENTRDAALAAGLVDVNVCAGDEEWSGLKLVYRLKDR
jgi:hypothetical protein